MSFNIVFGINKSEPNKITKTVTTAVTLTGTLRGECSVVDPVLLVSGSVSDYAGYNYLEIPTFGRKYFIRDIRSIRANVVEISCHCDVLSTYATQILACKAISGRSTNKWNMYLNDGSLKANQYPDYKCYSFPNGFTTQEFILAVAGG